MTTIFKRVDPSVPGVNRAVSFSATNVTADFEADDIIDIVKSLGRAAKWLRISVDSDAAVTVKLNSSFTVYPLYPDAKLRQFPGPDLTAGLDLTNDDAAVETVDNGGTLVIDDLPISNLEVTSVTLGTGTGITIEAR